MSGVRLRARDMVGTARRAVRVILQNAKGAALYHPWASPVKFIRMAEYFIGQSPWIMS